MENEVKNKVPETLKHRKLKMFLFLFSLTLIAIMVIDNCSRNKYKSNNNITINYELIHNRDYNNWSYYSDIDQMNSENRYFAECNSVNMANFKFPYDGGSVFKLTLRRESKKNFVLLIVSKGQFIGSYNSTLRVRFDDKKPENYSYVEPNDGSSDVIIINDSKRFINNLKKASIIRIEAEFYQEGIFIINFEVDGLKWQ